MLSADLPADAERILLVEDDAAVASQTYRGLVEVGFAVELATTAAGALDAARRFRPRLVVLDLTLPDGDGRDLIASLRASAKVRSRARGGPPRGARLRAMAHHHLHDFSAPGLAPFMVLAGGRLHRSERLTLTLRLGYPRASNRLKPREKRRNFTGRRGDGEVRGP